MIFLGLKKLTEEDLQEQNDSIMRSEYKDPVEQLPDKIDELFTALNTVIILNFFEIIYIFYYI